MIQEWHTSDLTADCMKAVQLRHEGKRLPDVGTALYRGSLIHECLAYVHRSDDWLISGKSCVKRCMPVVGVALLAEGRTMTKAVQENQDGIGEEVAALVEEYVGRFAAYFSGCELIGVEVPVRATLGFMNFASHLDLVVRDAGKLVLWDWKSGEAPSWEYLNRNLQLGTYALACKVGEVLIGGEWVRLDEFPRVAWCHVEYLKPFGRATNAVDEETGELRLFTKGERRPDHKVVQWLPPVDADAVIDELTTRQAMAEAGLWPRNPDAQGCRLCECRHGCGVFTKGTSDGTK